MRMRSGGPRLYLSSRSEFRSATRTCRLLARERIEICFSARHIFDQNVVYIITGRYGKVHEALAIRERTVCLARRLLETSVLGWPVESYCLLVKRLCPLERAGSSGYGTEKEERQEKSPHDSTTRYRSC